MLGVQLGGVEMLNPACRRVLCCSARQLPKETSRDPNVLLTAGRCTENGWGRVHSAKAEGLPPVPALPPLPLPKPGFPLSWPLSPCQTAKLHGPNTTALAPWPPDDQCCCTPQQASDCSLASPWPIPRTPGWFSPDGWLRHPGIHHLPTNPRPARAPALHRQLPPGWYLTSFPSSQERVPRARISPPQLPGCGSQQLPPRRMSPEHRRNLAPTQPHCGDPAGGGGGGEGKGAGHPAALRRLRPAVGARPPSRWVLAAGCSQPEPPAATGSGAPRWPCPAWAVPGTRTGKGSPTAAGRGRMPLPRGSPRSGRAGGSGAGPEEGAAVLLPFCTPGLRDPHAWLLPSLNKVSPTGSGGKKGRGWEWRGWGGLEPGGTATPRRPPAGSLPAAPRPLPLSCPAAAAKPGNASRKKEIRFPTEPGKLLNRNRKSRGLG